jgi:hypothetical protein
MTTWDYAYVRHYDTFCAVFPPGLVAAITKGHPPPSAIKINEDCCEDWLQYGLAKDARRAFRIVVQCLLKEGWEPFSADGGTLHFRRTA